MAGDSKDSHRDLSTKVHTRFDSLGNYLCRPGDLEGHIDNVSGRRLEPITFDANRDPSGTGSDPPAGGPGSLAGELSVATWPLSGLVVTSNDCSR